VALVLAWGLFGVQGVIWVIALPVFVVVFWFGRWFSSGGGHVWNDEIDADFERMRLERLRRQRSREGR
jgi:hypothetical protein